MVTVNFLIKSNICQAETSYIRCFVKKLQNVFARNAGNGNFGRRKVRAFGASLP